MYVKIFVFTFSGLPPMVTFFETGEGRSNRPIFEFSSGTLHRKRTYVVMRLSTDLCILAFSTDTLHLQRT